MSALLRAIVFVHGIGRVIFVFCYVKLTPQKNIILPWLPVTEQFALCSLLSKTNLGRTKV